MKSYISVCTHWFYVFYLNIKLICSNIYISPYIFLYTRMIYVINSRNILIAKPVETDFEQSANNFWLQKGDKLCTEFVLSDIVSKLLSEIWQSLLDMLYQQIGGRNRAKSCIIWWQIESRLRTESDSSRLARFLPPICWHSLSADFVDKSTAKCGHR